MMKYNSLAAIFSLHFFKVHWYYSWGVAALLFCLMFFFSFLLMTTPLHRASLPHITLTLLYTHKHVTGHLARSARAFRHVCFACVFPAPFICGYQNGPMPICGLLYHGQARSLTNALKTVVFQRFRSIRDWRRHKVLLHPAQREPGCGHEVTRTATRHREERDANVGKKSLKTWRALLCLRSVLDDSTDTKRRVLWHSPVTRDEFLSQKCVWHHAAFLKFPIFFRLFIWASVPFFFPTPGLYSYV